MRVASRILAPLSILILIVCLAGPLHAQAGDAAVAELTYVSTEGVYLNAGSDIGLRLGDTLEVRRGDRTIATVVINNISSKSAAAVVLAQTEAVQPGDLLFAVTIGVPPAEQPRLD